MRKSTFYQSALIISVFVTGLLFLSRLDPIYNTIGLGLPCVSFGLDLWFIWLFLAIFRNVRLPKWAHYVLVVVPICFFILTFDRFSYLWNRPYGVRTDSSIKVFAYSLLVPLIGIKPSCGKSIRSDIVVFALSFAIWLSFRFLIGHTANANGYGLYYYECPPVIFTYYISKIIAYWSLISLSCRDELKSAYDHKWVKIACVSFCVLATIIFFIWPGNYPLSYYNISGVYPLPVFWYIAYCIFRLFKKVFLKNMSWKSVVFDDKGI